MKKLLSTMLILLLSSSCLLAGGGWPQPKKSGFLKFSQWWLRANGFYNKEGNIIPITTTGVYTSSFYGEYGVTDRFTAIAYVPFFMRSTLNSRETTDGQKLSEGDALNGFGDVDLTFKYGLITKGPIVVSASLTLGIPSGNPSGGRTELLQTGDGEFNQMLTVEASHSFYPAPVYMTVLGAFNNRTNNFSDELRYGGEIGVSFWKFTAIARIYGVESLQNGDEQIVTANGIFNNNVEYISYTPELLFQATEHFGLSIGMGGAFSGNQILADRSYNAGVFWKF